MNATTPAWIVLAVAGLLEVAWSYAMKQSQGFTRLWPSVATVVAAGASFVLLSYALRVLPLGTAYAAWTGIGALGAFVLGIAVLGEPASALRLGSAALILLGLLGLKLTSGD
ncbi:MAG: DMT family transporter [Janthinobacterium lividum]